MSYIGNTNKSVSCIYGPFEIRIGEEVPMLYAVKFPQYVTKIKDPDPIVIKEPKEIPEIIPNDNVEPNESYDDILSIQIPEEVETKNERKGRKL